MATLTRDCPRRVERAALPVEPFRSLLPADALYDENSRPRAMTGWLWRAPRRRESEASQRR